MATHRRRRSNRETSETFTASAVSLSNNQLAALRLLKERAIAEENDINESILHYLGVISYLLHQYDLLYENCTLENAAYIKPLVKIIGITKYDIVTFLTQTNNVWMLVLPRFADIKTLCKDVLNPMLHNALNEESNDATLVSVKKLCQTMRVDKFTLSHDGQCIEIVKKDFSNISIITLGDVLHYATKHEEFKNRLKQDTYFNVITPKFYEMLQQNTPELKHMKRAIENYTKSSARFTAFTVAYMFKLPLGHVNKAIQNEYISQNCLLMKTVDAWKSFVRVIYPTFVTSLYSNVQHGYIEVYSGRNMLYSKSGRPLSILKGKDVYLTASMSTSVIPSISMSFLYRKPCPVFYKIKIPQHAFLETLPIGHISIYETEAEVLLPIGTKLHIDNIYPCTFQDYVNPFLLIEATVCTRTEAEVDIFRNIFECLSENSEQDSASVFTMDYEMEIEHNKSDTMDYEMEHKVDDNMREISDTYESDFEEEDSDYTEDHADYPDKISSSGGGKKSSHLSRYHNDIGVLTLRELIDIAESPLQPTIYKKKKIKDYIQTIDLSYALYSRLINNTRKNRSPPKFSFERILTTDTYMSLKEAIKANKRKIPKYYVVLFAYYGNPRTGYVSFEEGMKKNWRSPLIPYKNTQNLALNSFYKGYYNGDHRQKKNIENMKINEAILYFEHLEALRNYEEAQTLEQQTKLLNPNLLQSRYVRSLRVRTKTLEKIKRRLQKKIVEIRRMQDKLYALFPSAMET